ncbi:MAG: DUF2089 domain-containing protein [Firmicutes bacterium]|nr:DUF2089 domain-containing protein [Bacillota bacterium]MCL5039868.1 DUF2089 domain-containing protein [Bacillota bacterium]
MDQKRPMPGRCPVCGEKMDVVRLHCPRCDTSIEGHFQLSRLCGLTQEQRDFVEIFLKSRGNIKEVERELGISYPTVRSRLEAVIEALGYRVDTAAPEEERPQADRRKEILEALNRGEITAQEAVRLLKKL